MTNQDTNQEQAPAKSPVNIFKTLSSVKLTVICLVFLVVLVMWGSLYQAEFGLYQAQQKFFFSWFFLALGFIPFPGAVLVFFVLFVNLVCSLIYRIGFRWSNVGNIITHVGMLVLLLGSFYTFYFAEESSLVLMEGERGRMSSSRNTWEVALWENRGGNVDVFAVDTSGFDVGEQLNFQELNLQLEIMEYYENCTAYTGGSGGESSPPLSSSGIQALKDKKLDVEPTRNVAGTLLAITGTAGEKTQRLILYGQDRNPTTVSVNNKEYIFSLRKKKIPLPLEIKLNDFRIKRYPNSQIVKSFESHVTIHTDQGVTRDLVISMNKPLRYKDLTFFQSSYHIAQDGTEYTILAITKNAGRLLPYFSSTIIFIGLTVHFLMMLGRRKRGKKTKTA